MPDRTFSSAVVPMDRRTVSIPEAGRALGIHRNLAYKLARQNALPIPVIHLGERRMVVSRAALDALLAESRTDIPA